MPLRSSGWITWVCFFSWILLQTPNMEYSFKTTRPYHSWILFMLHHLVSELIVTHTLHHTLLAIALFVRSLAAPRHVLYAQGVLSFVPEQAILTQDSISLQVDELTSRQYVVQRPLWKIAEVKHVALLVACGLCGRRRKLPHVVTLRGSHKDSSVIQDALKSILVTSDFRE